MLPATDYDVWLLLLLNVLAGERVLFKYNHRFYNVLLGGMDVAPSFLKFAMYYLEHPGLVGSFSPSKGTGNLNFLTSKKLLDHNNIICLQEVHGKDEFLQATKVLAPQFRLFGAFPPDNENAGGSAICIHRELLPEEVIVTHSITCHRRDHLLNIRSERHSLVVVNVHFEPEPTLRQLRGGMGLIHPHWPAYPNGVDIFLGDFNICDPEEGRFHVWDQTFTDGDPGKTAVFHSFLSPTSLRLLNLTTREGTPQPLATYGLCQGLVVSLSIQPMAEARDFHCSSHVDENLGKKSLPSDHAAVRLVIQKPTSRGHQNVFPAGCQNIPFLVLSCSNFMMTTDSLLTRFVRWVNSKFFYTKAQKMTQRDLSRQTPDCIGAKLLITSTALRAYRNRHLGTLMRCCEAWKRTEDCFDTLSFECIDFQRLCHIFASFARENLATRETEVSTLPCTQTEKYIALARCRNGQRAWRNKKPVLTLSAVYR